jgi:hypothetical protein
VIIFSAAGVKSNELGLLRCQISFHDCHKRCVLLLPVPLGRYFIRISFKKKIRLKELIEINADKIADFVLYHFNPLMPEVHVNN